MIGCRSVEIGRSCAEEIAEMGQDVLAWGHAHIYNYVEDETYYDMRIGLYNLALDTAFYAIDGRLFNVIHGHQIQS